MEDVVLLGAPVEGEAKHWEPFRKVVSGRIINGYCRSAQTQARGVPTGTEQLVCPRPGPVSALNGSLRPVG